MPNRLRVVSNFGDGDCGAGKIHTRARQISRRRVASPRNFARPRVYFARPTITIAKITDYSQSNAKTRTLLCFLLIRKQWRPTRRVKQNTWNVIFCFLRLLRFLKAYLCKLIQVDRFGVFSWEFRPQKSLGNRILSAEFPSCWKLSENASWPYFTPWTTYLSFRKQ